MRADTRTFFTRRISLCALPPPVVAIAVFCALMAACSGVSLYLRGVFARSTPQSYAARFGVEAEFIEAGTFVRDGERYTCSRTPTVLNKSFADYGAAYFGFIILNPDRFDTMPLSLKRFAYAHECGHQYVGYSEVAADCYAVRLGLHKGWLDVGSLEEICSFFSRSRGTALHLPGPLRCASIRSCYRQANTGADVRVETRK